MHRYFVKNIDRIARIEGEDFLHLFQVLRGKQGDRLVLCDGLGMDYEAQIESFENNAAICRVGEGYPSGTEPRCRIALYQCLPKAGKFDFIVQKCTELGIHSITPVLSKRCVVVPKDFSHKHLRYKRIAYEAAKQANRGLVPEIKELLPLASLEPKGFDSMLVAYEKENVLTLKSVLRSKPDQKSVALVIGPEGGFDEEEILLLSERGAVMVSLGPRILRSETAGLAMLAQLLYEVEF